MASVLVSPEIELMFWLLSSDERAHLGLGQAAWWGSASTDCPNQARVIPYYVTFLEGHEAVLSWLGVAAVWGLAGHQLVSGEMAGCQLVGSCQLGIGWWVASNCVVEIDGYSYHCILFPFFFLVLVNSCYLTPLILFCLRFFPSPTW